MGTCFLKDISEQCRKVKADCFVCYAPENGDVKELQDILGKQKEYFPQTGESLGQRMYHSLEYVLGLGYDVCLLMGTDIPEVSSPDLEKAFQVLKEKDAVFGRTADGGYYLVGMKRTQERRPDLYEIYVEAHREELEKRRRKKEEKERKRLRREQRAKMQTNE
jgi:glycosyltransferase A (GT-A) superfamily protein (DUF2064 family)